MSKPKLSAWDWYLIVAPWVLVALPWLDQDVEPWWYWTIAIIALFGSGFIVVRHLRQAYKSAQWFEDQIQDISDNGSGSTDR